MNSEDRSQQKPSAWMPAKHRLAEICGLLRDRNSGPCQTDDGPAWLEAAVPALAEIHGGLDAPAFTGRIRAWAAEHVPTLSETEIEAVVAEARDRSEQGRLFVNAADLGNLLGLNVEERERLGIRMIRPAAMSLRQFRAYQRRRAAERKRQRRQEAGATPRAQSLARTKPWEAEGISRTEWFRRRKDKDERAEETAVIDASGETRETPVGTISAKYPSSTVRPKLSQDVSHARTAQPWIREGVSRATWFRRLRAQRLAEACAAVTGIAGNDNAGQRPRRASQSAV